MTKLKQVQKKYRGQYIEVRKCPMWDTNEKGEGFKFALELTLQDQYNNHESEQDPKDLEKLEKILTK